MSAPTNDTPHTPTWRLLRTGQAAEYLAMSSRSLRQLVDHGGEGRTVKLTQRVFELLKACCAGKGEDDYVFTRKNSKPVKGFREAWRTPRV